jgi:signal transduction histidine kinase/DNA-binding response OmpR family regulator
MKKILCLLTLISAPFFYAQEKVVYTSSISEEDSLTIAAYRIKMVQFINPYPDSAFYYSRKIKDLAVKRKYGEGIIDADYLIGNCFKRLQQNDSSVVYFKKALALSEELSYDIGAARAYNSLCRTYYLLGKMEESVAACEKAIERTARFEDPNNLIFADSHIALATAYARQNKLQEAIEKLLVVDSVHNVESLRPDVIAASYQNLGNIYLDLKNYDASENYYVKANNEFKKLPGDVSYYLHTTHIYLGRVYFFKDDLKKADSLLSISHTFFSNLKDQRNIAEISTYLGQVKAKENKIVEAENYFKEGFTIHKENSRNYEASLNVLELAKLAITKNQPNQAIEYLKEAEILNKTSKNSLVTQETYELLAKSAALRGDYKNAFTYVEKATHIKDSLQEIQSVEKIQEIEAIYQTERRDKEIELLTSKNELVEQQKRNQRNIFLGGLGLTFLVGLFFFFQYRNRQKTNKKLKELDKAKSTFFANISHEFRTPLTLIKGPLEDQINSETITKSHRKNLIVAKKNTQRLESLVEQLLALSKLESGNFKLKVAPGNLDQFVKAQAEAFTFSCKEKNLQYRVIVKDGDSTQWFDRDALEKIIFNLLGNAIKYSAEGGFVEIRANLKGIDQYEISVLNSGSYLNPEQKEKIFERFYQTDARNTGTGIGLALTKELVQLHKGNIFVESNAQEHTQFTIQIPVGKNHFEADEILFEELQKGDHTQTSNLEEYVAHHALPSEDAPILLVVDDNQEIRNYISSIFEATYQIHTANNGKEGISEALHLIPDIIISDVMMPLEDGFTLTKNLKGNELTAHIPVILLTAKIEDEDKLAGMRSGADAYLTKPFNAQLLKATVFNLIENRRKLQARFAQEVIVRPKDIALSTADEQFLERLQKVLDEHLTDSNFSADLFSTEMGVSRMQLHRKLKAITGQSTTEFLRVQRLKLAASLLKENKVTISEIGYIVGFNDPSYFAKCFKQEFGRTPTEYIS